MYHTANIGQSFILTWIMYYYSIPVRDRRIARNEKKEYEGRYDETPHRFSFMKL